MKCLEEKTCHFNQNGECIILTDTLFRNSDGTLRHCPFFKDPHEPQFCHECKYGQPKEDFFCERIRMIKNRYDPFCTKGEKI